jgi:membrane protease YdiL (CAAX protease family)
MDLNPPPPSVPPLPDSLLAPEPTEVPWRAREGFLVALLAFITGGFFSLILTAIVDPRPGELGDDTRTVLILTATILIEGSLALWVWLWVKLRHRAGTRELRLVVKRGDVGAGVLAALLGLAVSWLVGGVITQIVEAIRGRPIKQPEQLPSDLHGAAIVLAAFAVIVVAPIAEELFFRGFIYQALRKWRGVMQAVLISAAVFAIAHFDPLLIAGIFPLGIVLAYLFERRGSLGATIAAHMSYNLIGFILIVVVSR